MAIIKVADEVWVAMASLHRRYPDREDYSVSEIVAQAEAENATGAGSCGPACRFTPICIASPTASPIPPGCAC